MYNEVLDILENLDTADDLLSLYAKLESYALEDPSLEEKLFKMSKNILDRIKTNSPNPVEINDAMHENFSGKSAAIYHLSELILKKKYNCMGHSMIFLYLLEKMDKEENILFGYLPTSLATGVESHIIPVILSKEGEPYYIDYSGPVPKEFYELVWGMKPVLFSKNDFLYFVVDDYLSTIHKNNSNEELLNEIINLRKYIVEKFPVASPRLLTRLIGDLLVCGDIDEATKWIEKLVDVYISKNFSIDGYKYMVALTNFVKSADKESGDALLEYAIKMGLLRYGNSTDWLVLSYLASGRINNGEVRKAVEEVLDELSPRVRQITKFYLENNNIIDAEEKILLDMMERVDTYELLMDFKRKKQKEILNFFKNVEIKKNSDIIIRIK